MNHTAAVTSIGLAFVAWTALAWALARSAQLRALGTAATPWLSFASAAMLGAIALELRPPGEAVTCGVACIALAIAADADARTGYLFDAITIPAAVLVLALAFATGSGLAGTIGCGLLVVAFGLVVAVSRGRAMGLGDVKAMASIGAAFGPAESMLALAAACASGIVEAGFRGRFKRHAEIRFGPHLAVGAAVALAWGEPFTRFVIGG